MLECLTKRSPKYGMGSHNKQRIESNWNTKKWIHNKKMYEILIDMEKRVLIKRNINKKHTHKKMSHIRRIINNSKRR